MKRMLQTLVLTIVSSNLVFGALLYLPIEKRVQESNLIVIGTLINVSLTETEDFKIEKGALVIEEVLYGNFSTSSGRSLKSGDQAQIEWRNSKMFACQFGYSENEKQIWFLKVDNEGNIESLHNNAADSLNELAEVKKHLKKHKGADKTLKNLKLINETAEITAANRAEKNNHKIVNSNAKPAEQKEYYPFPALLTVAAAISLYYFLYRSRFKIR